MADDSSAAVSSWQGEVGRGHGVKNVLLVNNGVMAWPGPLTTIGRGSK